MSGIGRSGDAAVEFDSLGKPTVEPTQTKSIPKRAPRPQGSGGIFPVRDVVWRVDIELPRDKVADQQRRLPSGGTSARSVRAAFDQYLDAADTGVIELAPRTIHALNGRGIYASVIALPDPGTTHHRHPNHRRLPNVAIGDS